MIATDPLQYILGLDLGPSSIGWAIIALENGEPAAVAAAGVRRFEAGVQGDIEAGRDESRATQRRDARSPRRQTWRRQYHLSQRRGYQSNRKAAKEDDDRSVVKKGTSELEQAITAAGARTLGEYFAGLLPRAKMWPKIAWPHFSPQKLICDELPLVLDPDSL